MTSLTEQNPQSPIVSASIEGDVCEGVSSVALDLPKEWMRFCYRCNEETKFAATSETLEGFLGECTACGDQRIALFSRRCS